jgi:hypothetical protein
MQNILPTLKKPRVYIPLAVLAILYIAFNVFLYFGGSKYFPVKKSSRPIPHGPKGFTVGQSDKTVPQLRRGTLDPYDPQMGATQSATIAVKHSQPVNKVTAILITDHGMSDPISFTLINGTNTDGQWQGSWKVTDSYLYTYTLILRAESKNNNVGSVTITLR